MKSFSAPMNEIRRFRHDVLKVNRQNEVFGSIATPESSLIDTDSVSIGTHNGISQNIVARGPSDL